MAVIADNYQLLILTAPKAPAGLGQCAEGAHRAGAVPLFGLDLAYLA